MDHLPIFLDLKGKKVIVTGGGIVAARRTEMALRAGAKVEVFAPQLDGEFSELVGNENLTHHTGNITSKDLENCIIAYGGTGDETADKALAEMARAAGILVNVADDLENCDFITPSIVDRDPLVIAVSTGGTSPILARTIRARLEVMLPAAYGDLARFVGSYRDAAMKKLKAGSARLRFWEAVTTGPVADLFLAGDEDGAKVQLNAELEAAVAGTERPQLGEVYLVGGGPGDPDLLTFRALRLMQLCDVVVYDRLVGEGIMNLVRRDAERIYVGKMPRQHIVPQEEISLMLVRLAKEGKRVLRLKGGDPFIFGRGGEEIEALAAEQIPFQVVPGITAASGCSTYAGIPLTHRDHAQACVFTTAHGRDGVLDVDWDVLLRPNQTVAIYMGLSNTPHLCKGFIERGADPNLPVAVIDNGTRPQQRVITATVSTLCDVLKDADFKGPAMIIVGTVVNLRENLSWYKTSMGTMHADYATDVVKGWVGKSE
ncbi:MAG TPA: uroporphyrinogen-III C-methyltransferase [Rhizobiales bacterium]|nr:uroporphyrinogen-III C-methyltransferase [Hyphomicrobiales bacterium]